MNRPGPSVFVCCLLAALAFAGCARPYDPCHGSGSPHNLDLVVEPGIVRDDTVIHTFTCETEYADHPIDRYTFWLAFPRTNIIQIEPTADQHTTAPGRPLVHHVTEGLHHRWHPSTDAPADSAAHYRITWNGWDPDERGHEGTTIEVAWIDSASRTDELPPGLYGIRVGIRGERDRTPWSVVDHEEPT